LEHVAASLTVYFEDPFWVGVYEREEGETLTVSRMVFGAEPREGEVYELLLSRWGCLRFSPPVAPGKRPAMPGNPKRAQREAHKAVEQTGVGTKAQQAMKLQQEQGKWNRKSARRERAEAEKERRFLLRRQKQKEKHRGR
jgi:hypothetical protein